jgi:hypothetical protein
VILPVFSSLTSSAREQAERLWSFAHDMLWDYPGGMPAGRRVLYPHEHQANADISPNVAIEGGCVSINHKLSCD